MKKKFKCAVLFSIGFMSLMIAPLAQSEAQPVDNQPALLADIDAVVLSERSMNEVRGESKYTMIAFDSSAILLTNILISFNKWDENILSKNNKLPTGVDTVGDTIIPGLIGDIVELLGGFSWRYGNWGGQGWSNNGSSSTKLVAGVDGMDELFKTHDLAYNRAAKNKKTEKADIKNANITLLNDLNSLHNSTTIWGKSYVTNANKKNEPIPSSYVTVYLNLYNHKSGGSRLMMLSDYARRQAVLAFRYKTK